MSALLIVIGAVPAADRRAPARRPDRRGGRRRLLRGREVHRDAPLPRRLDGLRPPVPGPGARGRDRVRRRAQDRVRQPRLHDHHRARAATRCSTSCRSWRRSPSSPGGGRSACCARVPGFFFTMLATRYPTLTRLGFQYTAYWTSFLFLAVVANLRWLDRAERAAAPNPAARRRPPQPPRLEGRDGGGDAGDLLPARPRVPAATRRGRASCRCASPSRPTTTCATTTSTA